MALPIALPDGNATDLSNEATGMLAPWIVEMLIGCTLLLLAGWARDAFRAGIPLPHGCRRDVGAAPSGDGLIGSEEYPSIFYFARHASRSS